MEINDDVYQDLKKCIDILDYINLESNEKPNQIFNIKYEKYVTCNICNEFVPETKGYKYSETEWMCSECENKIKQELEVNNNER